MTMHEHIGEKGRFLVAGRTAIGKPKGAPADAPFLYVEIADTFWRRFRGLMGRSDIAPAHALLIFPCSGVHMFFMRFAVDVVYMKRLEESERLFLDTIERNEEAVAAAIEKIHREET